MTPIQKLVAAIAEQKSFNGDTLDQDPVEIVQGNTCYELIYENPPGLWHKLTFADLQAIVKDIGVS